MDWKIRAVGPEDALAVAAADVYDGPARADWVRRFLGAAAAPDPRNLMFVAEVAGRICGFVSGMVQDHPDKPPTLYIGELGVNEAQQRQGIARALVQTIRSEGRARGCQATWVLTEGDNLAALALYRDLGGSETRDVVMFDWDEPVTR
jgi:ribosomal protein S18 acetylase RimI-like enzyme